MGANSEWIKIRVCLPEEPEVLAIAGGLLEIVKRSCDAAGVTDVTACNALFQHAAVGALARLWGWADTHTLDGTAQGMTREGVDAVIGFKGIAGYLEAVGWAEFTDCGLRLPNYERHNGQTSKARDQTARRMNNLRTRRKEGVTATALQSNAPVTPTASQNRQVSDAETVTSVTLASSPNDVVDVTGSSSRSLRRGEGGGGEVGCDADTVTGALTVAGELTRRWGFGPPAARALAGRGMTHEDLERWAEHERAYGTPLTVHLLKLYVRPEELPERVEAPPPAGGGQAGEDPETERLRAEAVRERGLEAVRASKLAEAEALTPEEAKRMLERAPFRRRP